MKKYFALLLAGVMALSLAACGGSSSAPAAPAEAAALLPLLQLPLRPRKKKLRQKPPQKRKPKQKLPQQRRPQAKSRLLRPESSTWPPTPHSRPMR